eukprot:CAMPEP_0170488104 /NCGR_PEP_ID=MMETSP0208-20121228/6721_1 /TAXON_ID=197538 /ORGANISM="Strombidium inclinatum, Strain S3" /LENGTH=156 /DNA_ID=CAMNT_0010762553 /DNA_START=411 /DNA_END=881 /DNA_ORIENTATION=+
MGNFQGVNLVKSEEEKAAIQLVGLINDFDSLYLIGFFMNTFIIFMCLKTQESKRNFLVSMCVIVCFFQNLNFLKVQLVDPEKNLYYSFAIFSALAYTIVIDSIFVLTLFSYQKIDYGKLKLEVEENKKFKFMFNFIEDGVILCEGDQVSFMNSHAL